ncbi:MAG TPA: hypothetical protein VNL77_19245 [Roseiflexaceae bacterium]|nr:hypothetical protein [Roseiflexaceae bacterium]
MPHRQPYRLALQAFQSRRLRRDHADLAAEPQYRAIAEFFFEEIYGPRDFTRRDEQARRMHVLVGMAPGVVIRDVEQVLELLDLTNLLDESVVEQLHTLGAPHDFDEPTYERAYRLADNYDDRRRQIQLVRDALYNVYKLARRPLIDIALHRTRGIAHAAGLADIHRFLLTGFEAIKPVRDIHRFVETICVREESRLDRIYTDRLRKAS